MNPCALWRWIGSILPGGYSTVIIRPSLPGKSVSSFEKSSVTFASFESIATDIRLTSTKSIFAIVIHCPFVLTSRLECDGQMKPRFTDGRCHAFDVAARNVTHGEHARK